MSVRSTIAAAFTPIAIAIASETSSRVAPNLSAFLTWPSRQPWHLAARLAAMAISSFVLRSSDRGPVGLLVELEVDLAEARLDHGVGGRLRAGGSVVVLRERLVVRLLVDHRRFSSLKVRRPRSPTLARRETLRLAAAGDGLPRALQQRRGRPPRRRPCRRARRRRGSCQARPALAARCPAAACRSNAISFGMRQSSEFATNSTGRPARCAAAARTSIAAGSKPARRPIQNSTSSATGQTGTIRSHQRKLRKRTQVVARPCPRASGSCCRRSRRPPACRRRPPARPRRRRATRPTARPGRGERSRAKRADALTSSFSFAPKVVATPPLAPWWRRSMTSAFQPAPWTNGTRRTISMRERFSPCTITTLPFGESAGTHQPRDRHAVARADRDVLRGEPEGRGREARVLVIVVDEASGGRRARPGTRAPSRTRRPRKPAAGRRRRASARPSTCVDSPPRMECSIIGEQAEKERESMAPDTTDRAFGPLWGHSIGPRAPSPRRQRHAPPSVY